MRINVVCDDHNVFCVVNYRLQRAYNQNLEKKKKKILIIESNVVYGSLILMLIIILYFRFLICNKSVACCITICLHYINTSFYKFLCIAFIKR